MDYKHIAHIAFKLVVRPAEAWAAIKEEDKNEVLSAFVYPLIGLTALCVFIGMLGNGGWNAQNLRMAMTRCCAVAVALFCGFFLAAHCINKYRMHALRRESDTPLVRQFAGYAMVVVFLLDIILALFPNFFFIGMLLQFYIIYVVWEGADVLMEVPDDKRMQFTIVSSLFLLLAPWLIQKVFMILVNYL